MEELYFGFTCRNFGLCGSQVEKELKTADDIQFVVTSTEMVGLYCRDYPLKDPPLFLSGLLLLLKSSFFT